MRNSDIEEFQRLAGIKPARGAQLDALIDMQRKAFELIRVIELERCGIRDGDAADCIGSCLDFNVVKLFKRRKTASV
jgi:hypothetical protein